MTGGPTASARAARRMGLVAAGVVLCACGGGGEASTPQPRDTTAGFSSSASAPPAPTDDGKITGKFAVGDRELWISCIGTGSPTLVLEAGEAVPSGVMATPVQQAFVSRVRVCSYDRANTGASGSAPTPRAASDIAADLNGLLEAADVPRPYVLVGHSAGGMFVQSYARMYPESVVGVVAMNPVPPWDLWVKRAFPAMTKAERRGETAYYAGENGESFDYRLSSRQIDAESVPPTVAFHLLISTSAQCESPTDICSAAGRTRHMNGTCGTLLPSGRMASSQRHPPVTRSIWATWMPSQPRSTMSSNALRNEATAMSAQFLPDIAPATLAREPATRLPSARPPGCLPAI
jgi:pimeloyl-ACP methyl ester carboxylesterase